MVLRPWKARALLATALSLAAVAFGPRASSQTATTPCVFSAAGDEDPSVACTEYTKTDARLIGVTRFRSRAPEDTFGTDLVALADGSAVVQVRVPPLRPPLPNPPFEFMLVDAAGNARRWQVDENKNGCTSAIYLARYSDGVMAMCDPRTLVGFSRNGEVAFHFTAATGDDIAQSMQLPARQDAHGIVWIDVDGKTRRFVAYDPRNGRTLGDAANPGPGGWFTGADGVVYASSNTGLFALDAFPSAHLRYAYPAIWERDIQAQAHHIDWVYNGPLFVDGVGRDGSVWLSSNTQVVHIHPGGRTAVLRLAPPLTRVSLNIPPIRAVVSRDDAAWVRASGGYVRIAADDRVEVVNVKVPGANHPSRATARSGA